MRYAFRQLIRVPSFTAVAVLTLALGIATVTTIFAIVDEVAFKPARNTGDPLVHTVNAATVNVMSYGGLQIPDYETLAASPPAGLDAIAAMDYGGGGLVQIPGRAEHMNGIRVSGQYASVHRVHAQVGRWISDEDNAGGEQDPTREIAGRKHLIVRGAFGADVAVISNRLWREWFDADRSIVGAAKLRVNGQWVRIIGVAPPGFEPSIDVWRPFGTRRLLTRKELDEQWAALAKRKRLPREPELVAHHPFVQAQIRRAPGVDIKEMSDRLTAVVFARPEAIEMPRAPVRLSSRRGDERNVSTGYAILIFAALVFVAACANLGNMLYGRAMEREGELATRLALGASRKDIATILFSETVLIAVAGTAGGLALAAGALDMFENAVPAFQTTAWSQIRLDLGLDFRIFAFASIAGALATLIVGAGAIWRSSRAPLLARLSAAGPAVLSKTEGRTLRTMLVAVQVSAAVLLLIATGILLESTSRQLDRRLQFDIDGLVAARIELPDEYDKSRGPHFFGRLLDDLRNADGVESVSMSDALPGGDTPAPRAGTGAIGNDELNAVTGMTTRIDGKWVFAAPGFIETLGLTLRGRDFDARDLDGSTPVAMVSESTARKLWPDRDAVGQRLLCCGDTYKRTVVAVVADPVISRGTSQALTVADAQSALTEGSVGQYVFLPAAQFYRPDMLIVLRTSKPDATVDALRRAVVALDPDVPVFLAGPVYASQFSRASSEHAVRTLAGALAGVALGITVFGVFAVVAYFVSRRSREFGLRLALGATRGQIVKLVVDYSIHITLIGLLPGVLFASLGTNVFQSQLTKLRPNGITMWVVVPLLLVACALIAAYIPARRAARTDPIQTLKEM